MRKHINRFMASEDGAITVDWVVLTALVLGVQILLLLTPMRTSLVDVSESIGAKASEAEAYLGTKKSYWTSIKPWPRLAKTAAMTRS